MALRLRPTSTHHGQGYAVEDLARVFGITEQTIKNHCKDKGIVGAERVAWEVHRSWPEARERTIERDGECVISGITNDRHEQEYGRELDVHHILPKKVFDEERNADAPENLVAVCVDCHPEVEVTPRELFQRAFD